jgi:colanic acid/amylovoran biosynthesis glycosyltransferase
MKIGYVMDRFPHVSHDFLLQEILALESRGVDVHIFSLGMPAGRIDDTAAALARLRSPVRYFPADMGMWEAAVSASTPNRATFESDSIAPDLTGNGITSRQAQWTASLVAIRRIEHLHAHGATAPTDVTREAGRLTGVGYSFTAHADGLYGGSDLSSLREKIQDARFAVTLSNFDRGHLLRMCGRGIAEKLHRIPMGVNPDESRFASAECHDSDSVLAVGPLVEKSGFTDLIEAIGMLRDRGRVARLTIIGEGEFEATLRNQIDRYRLGRSIRLIGAVSRSELTTLMRVHTAMALPWVADDRDRDLLANMVLEAMAVGLPVLSTDLPGIRELIDDGRSGRVISPHDPLWLAGVLETLFDSPVLREHMACRARCKVERRFDASRNALQLAQLFSEAVATKRLAT